MADGALGDLFGFAGQDLLLAGVRRYASGVAAPAIWAGYAAAGVPMCLVAARLPREAVARALAYRRAGHSVLVDSGAFVFRKKPWALNWDSVLAVYQALADGPGTRLSLILPDVVGDQVGSIALAAAHGLKLARLAAQGHEMLVPMQRGAIPLHRYFQLYVAALGFKPGGFAIPSNAAAMPVAELAGLRVIRGAPRRVHFLGISRRSAALAERLELLHSFWPYVTVSGDACEHRAQVGEKRPVTKHRREVLQAKVELAVETLDDTEDPAWESATSALRRQFPELDEDELADVVCSGWGSMEFMGQLRQRLERQHGPASTAASIEAFARRRFG